VKVGFSKHLMAVLSGLVVSLGITGMQGKRILMLEAVPDGRAAPLAEGTLPPLDLIDARGRHSVVDYRSMLATLIYVFSYSCIRCKHNSDSFRAANDTGVNFPAYEFSGQTVSSYKPGGTPATILVSAEGKLVKEWSGAYRAPRKLRSSNILECDYPQREVVEGART